MNAGKQVFCAGELQIDNQGKLLMITTHSGHYRPSNYSLYKFLQHLESQGVDISEVKIRGIVPPPKGITRRKDKNSFLTMYEYNACDLFDYVKRSLIHNVNSINDYASSGIISALYKKFGNKELTTAREKMADDLATELNDLFSNSSYMSNFTELRIFTKELESVISKYQIFNNDLSQEHGKSKDSGRFSKTMQKMRDELKSISNADDLQSDIKSKLCGK